MLRSGKIPEIKICHVMSIYFPRGNPEETDLVHLKKRKHPRSSASDPEAKAPSSETIWICLTTCVPLWGVLLIMMCVLEIGG
jgi:hypothetical protein